MISFILNNETIKTDAPNGTVLLDFIRDARHIKGTKEGCREGDCGACLVIIGRPENGTVKYQAINSCLVPIGDVAGCHVVTIEGIDTGQPNPLQQAFVDEGASQCGYCTPGFIMAEMSYLINSKDFNAQKAIQAVDGNICRCTGYKSIQRSISRTCKDLQEIPHQKAVRDDRIMLLIEQGFLPDYFEQIPQRLKTFLPQNGITQNVAISVSGGTDLYVQKEPQISDKNIQLLFNKNEYKGIFEDNGNIILGAAATITDMQNSEIMQNAFPKLETFIKLHSSEPIRNRATFGGNIVNASPIGDMTIFLLALDAKIILTKNGSERTVPLKSFYSGYKQFDLKEKELIKNITFPKKLSTRFNFEKVSRRTYLDIASVNSAISVESENGSIIQIHLSAGGVAPFPFYLKKTCQQLSGMPVNNETLNTAIESAKEEISPISDMRGSAEYKSLLLQKLIQAHFLVLFPDKIKEQDLI